MAKVRDWLVAGIVLLLGRGKPRPRELPRARIVATGPSNPRAELAVALLLLLAASCAAAFVVVYAWDAIPAQTQFLGLALGLAFVLAAAASLIAGKRVLPSEEIEEPYPVAAHELEQGDVAQIAAESVDRITRKRLLVLSGGAAGTALGAALLTPALSLGPLLDAAPLRSTPWRRGVRLLDPNGKPLAADDLAFDSFATAYPEDANPELIGSPLVVVRVEAARLDLPNGRAGWAPHGIVAYSKICTHAGCAVALYRAPLYEPTTARPALVCPCHYSTFDPATGGTVLFGPAGRPLPQLPLEIDGDGILRAAGGFSGPIGPSWWGVRQR